MSRNNTTGKIVFLQPEGFLLLFYAIMFDNEYTEDEVTQTSLISVFYSLELRKRRTF